MKVLCPNCKHEIDADEDELDIYCTALVVARGTITEGREVINLDWDVSWLQDDIDDTRVVCPGCMAQVAMNELIDREEGK